MGGGYVDYRQYWQLGEDAESVDNRYTIDFGQPPRSTIDEQARDRALERNVKASAEQTIFSECVGKLNTSMQSGFEAER